MEEDKAPAWMLGPSYSMEGARVIVVSEDRLKHIRYLLEQSQHGNHILFDVDAIRAAVARFSRFPMTEENAYEAEPHVERILALPTLAQKRAYLDRLDKGSREIVIQTYLSIVENDLLERTSKKAKH